MIIIFTIIATVIIVGCVTFIGYLIIQLLYRYYLRGKESAARIANELFLVNKNEEIDRLLEIDPKDRYNHSQLTNTNL